MDRVRETPSGADPAAQGTAFETVLPLSEGEDGASALAPPAAAAAAPERGVWRAEARFFNGTQDIWLVSWSCLLYTSIARNVLAAPRGFQLTGNADGFLHAGTPSLTAWRSPCLLYTS